MATPSRRLLMVVATSIGPSASLPVLLGAQVDAVASDTPVAPRPFCFRPRVASECARFLVLEMAYERALYSTRTPFNEPDFDWRLTWTVGPMFNVGPQTAAGVTATLRVAPGGPYPSIEGRYRHWASAEQSADFMGGLAFYEVWSNPNESTTAVGITAAAALASRDLLGVALRGEWLLTGGRPVRALFIEGHVGSTLTPVATAALIIGFFVAFAQSVG